MSTEVAASAASYNEATLRRYDMLVLGLVSRFVWRCPRTELLAQYQRNVGTRHLDLGPGTGFFLDHTRFPVGKPSLTLVDLNPTVLATAARRVARYDPVTERRDVLEPLDLGDKRFDSIGLNYLLHCLPGGRITAKAAVFDHAAEYLADGGRIFGSTVLAEGVRHNAAARRLLRSLNDKQTFDNLADSLTDLTTELGNRFRHYTVRVSGSVALFEVTDARKPDGTHADH